MTNDERNALLSMWCLRLRPRLYGFLVKTLYSRDIMEEIAQRTFEYVLYSKNVKTDSYETFLSYTIKVAQSFTYTLVAENKGFLKPTMAKIHQEKVKTFTYLKGDRSDDEFFETLDRLSVKSETYTSIGKKELMDYIKPHLTKKQFDVLELRLAGYSLSEIGEELGITGKTASSHVEAYKAKINKLLLNQ